jgi:hypothetical protein
MPLPAVDLVGTHEKLGLLAAETGDRKTALVEERFYPELKDAWRAVIGMVATVMKEGAAELPA